MNNLLEEFAFYKNIQSEKYDKNNQEVKQKLQNFRKNLGDFTDTIFVHKNGLIALEKGMWQNSGNFTKYMWNRYKLQDDYTNLVIYFNASTIDGFFIGIGLIDDKLNEYEKEHGQEIYDFLDEECKKMQHKDFDTTSNPRKFVLKEIERYDQADYDTLIGELKKVYVKALNKFYKTENNESKKKNNSVQYPLNQILFGPPGTGKTYNIINKALEIIDGGVPQKRSDAKERFEEFKKAGQIEFVTFHQSYGYEEFVEGIRAIPVGQEGNENGEEMIYDVKDGIFKQLAKKAKLDFFTTSNQKNIKRKFLLNAKALNIQAEMIEDDANSYRVLKGSKIRKGEADSFKRYNYVHLKNKVLESAKYVEKDEFYLLEEDYVFESMSAASSVILGRQSNGYNDWKEAVENDVKINETKDTKNYVLIIDEINRGNISKIFGELITLIEPSKRIGAEEEIRLKLPYSNDEFGVPSNLYILGTMNTADRSIALMDTALRRRFSFVEMPPKAELLNFEVDGIHIQTMLEKINKRIEYLYDRDHMIGHAYFMSLQNNPSLDELESIFRDKIIPLLQEYFYDDWEKIVMVLGEGFIQKEEVNGDIFDYKQEEYLEEDTYVYRVRENFDFEKFR